MPLILINEPWPERWLPVPGYERIYEVSNHGRVKVLDKMVNSGLRHVPSVFRAGKIMKSRLFENGYLRVCLIKNGKGKGFACHVLVAMAFLKKYGKKNQVNHKNGIKTDNNLHNIEWVTGSENMRHAIETGLSKCIGEDNHLAKLTEQQVIAMRNDLADGMTIPQIISKYQTPPHATRNAMKNKSWKYLLKSNNNANSN